MWRTTIANKLSRQFGDELKMERLLNPKQFAELLNVKPGTVYSWLSRGVDLPPFIKISGSTRWQEKTVKAWIEKKEQERREKNFER